MLLHEHLKEKSEEPLVKIIFFSLPLLLMLFNHRNTKIKSQ